MIVTRNAQFTDWTYQGAHANEVAATVGNGLLEGHIYFRYVNDFLKEGERILRSRSFITLSDDTTYELGAGEVAPKVTVIDHGVTSGGEVHVEVRGVDGSGIGVFSITRHVTIEYDDGKVPVLDQDQMKIIMAELSDNLTESMVDTANAIKEELRTEITNVTHEVDNKLTSAKAEIGQTVRENMDNVTQNLESVVDSAKVALNERVDNVSSDLASARDELSRRINTLLEAAPRICGWGHSGYFTARDDNWVNFLSGAPGSITGNTEFLVREGNFLKLTGGVKPYDRVLRITITGRIGFMLGGDVSERVRFSARRYAGDVIAETSQYFVAVGANDLSFPNMQFELTLRIHANDANNPLLTSGVALSFGRVGAQQVRLSDPGVTCELISTI